MNSKGMIYTLESYGGGIDIPDVLPPPLPSYWSMLTFAGGGHHLALDVYANQPWHRFYLGGGKAEHLFDNYSMSQIFPWPGSLILTNREGTSFRARKYCHVIIKKVYLF